ncbi:MAG: glycosyltransferase family 4 protein [Candidatus Pacebacteria bacterium]|nr:glycosyltransferase family 4 protein [Candidatus Paceibacterota bacterium]
MKVLIATGLYPPEIGGPATYTVLLEKELPKLGYSVDVVAFTRSTKFPRVIRHIHFFLRVIKHAVSADLIFAQDVSSAGFPAWLVAKILGKRFFIRVPGDYAWEQSTQRFGVKEGIDEFQNKKYSFKVETLRLVQKIVTKYADIVVTPSNYFKHLVTNWGVNPKKVHAIYNGVDLDIKADLPEKVGKKMIVTSGRLVPWKGFDVLIKIMKDLPDWDLVILGSGPEEERLKELSVRCNVVDRVHLMGQATRQQVFGWCCIADVFVLNTHFESFSYQIVEAMYSGTPVITTTVGSLPELIDSGAEGLLVNPDDEKALVEGIESVCTEKELWHKRTLCAQDKAKTFSIAETMKKLDTLIKNTK